MGVKGFLRAYEQAIDARVLPEGMNFLTVRAYRQRNAATGGDGASSAR